jgi:glycosyltransferase involved in cell wall biosynthesis
MHVVLFCQPLLSDCEYDGAQFLRGVATELSWRGHDVHLYESAPPDASDDLIGEQQRGDDFRRAYPRLQRVLYHEDSLDRHRSLAGADLVIAGADINPAVLDTLGRWRASHKQGRLLLYANQPLPTAVAQSHFLPHFDGILASSQSLRGRLLAQSGVKRAWTWREAVDTRIFPPLYSNSSARDVVLMGSWPEEQEQGQWRACLYEAMQSLDLKIWFYGRDYPDNAGPATGGQAGRQRLIRYGGWQPAFSLPRQLNRFRVAIYLPFENPAGCPRPRQRDWPLIAMACGIPLLALQKQTDAPLLPDLVQPGRDYLPARTGQELKAHLRAVLYDPTAAHLLGAQARQTLLESHTCAHRTDELLDIYDTLLPTAVSFAPASSPLYV